MLRAAFIGLSQNKSLRNFAERSALGHRLSGRFVAGMTVDEAIAATQAVLVLGAYLAFFAVATAAIIRQRDVT